MTNIDLPIWNKCNNRCLMCTNSQSMKKAQVFNYDWVINYLKNEVRKNKIKNLQTIGLTGGETTICPYFFQIIDYIQEKFPKTTIRVLTNGRMLIYDSFRKKCLTFKNIDFIIPLHGFNAGSHDRITQTPGSFYQTTEGLKKLLTEKGIGQEVEIRLVITRLNLNIIPTILKLIENKFLEVDRVVLIFLEFEGMAELNKDIVGITYHETQPILFKIKKYFKKFKDLRLYHFPLCLISPDFWPYCWRTLPKQEIAFLPECQECLVKIYCLGIHKSYSNFVKKLEIKPWLSLKGIKIKKSGNFYKPINSVAITKKSTDILNDFKKSIRIINSIPEEDDFFIDKLYFLLNLKEVIRLKRKNRNLKETIRGLEGIKYVLYDDYIFLSKNIEKAKLARQLTKMQKEKQLSKEENQKFEILLGKLYGYSECCAKNFPKINTKDPKQEKKMSLRTEFNYKNKKLYLLYYPCSKSCKETKKLKKLIKTKLDNLCSIDKLNFLK